MTAHSEETLEAADSRSFDTIDDAAAALSGELDGTLTDDEGDILEEDLDDEPEGDELDGEESEESEGDEPDDEEDEQEPEPETAIDAPASLTAEEKENFAQLPPEAQLAMKSFANRRDQEVQQGLEKARSAQREVSAQAAETAAAAKRTAAESIYNLASAYEPQMPDPSRFQDLHQYNQAKYQYDQAKAQHDQVVQQAVSQFEAATAEEKAVSQEFIADRDKRLMEIPEVASEETRQKYLDDVFAVAEELGFEKSFLAENGDVRDIKAMGQAAAWKAKADQWDKLQSQKMKSVRSGKTVKSKATQPRSSRKQEGFKKSRQQLRSSGDVRDAAAAIASLE